jgi:hypothetical protein
MAYPVAEIARAASAPARAAQRRVGPGYGVLVPIGLLVLIALVGAPYYLAPLGERLRHPLHAWLRPSGYVGQSAGLATFAGFLFMWLFPLRKRFRRLEWAGPVPRWLDVHIGVGLVLPLLGAVHAGFRVGGVIGLGYIAMLIVCASGVVGRYLYVRIPRSRSGVEMGLSEVAAHQRGLLAEIADATGLTVVDVQEILKVDSSPVRVGIAQTLLQMVRDDLARGRAVRRLRHRVIARGGAHPEGLRKIAALARREMALSQHARLLDATQAVFRHWHAAHRPFAITAFIAVTIHVVVVIAVGATWF